MEHAMSMMHRAPAARQSQQGVAIVEYVIVLPLCLLLILAAAEFGRAFLQYNTMTQSVQDGVRLLATRGVFGSTGNVVISPEIEAEVQNLVVYGNRLGSGEPRLPGFDTNDVTVSEDGFGNVTVAVSYAYNSIFLGIPRFFQAGSIDVTGYTFQTAVTMRALAL